MKLKKYWQKVISCVLVAVLAISSAGVTALAAGETPVGYIVALPNDVASGEDVQSSAAYIKYKNLLENQEDAISSIYNAILSVEESVDVSGYNLTVSDMSALSAVFFNSFPELWYLKQIGCYYYTNQKIASVYFSYVSETDIPGKTQEFKDVAAERYLSLVDDSMDDFTKAVILHDALVLNAYYPADYNTNRGNNYTFMVENYGVCQYYSGCYAYLLAQCGIESEIVISDSMDHSWVKAKLDGAYYNVDVTWDDPMEDLVGKAAHSYFLYSDAEFQRTDESLNRDAHYGYMSINSANSGVYDGFDNLHLFNTQLCYLDGTFYAIRMEDGEIVQYDHTNDSCTPKKSLGFAWPAQNGYYYSNNYSSLAEYGGKLYYNGPWAVYEYDPATGDTKLFAEGEGDKPLYGLRIMNDELWGVYASSPIEGFVEPTYMKDMPAPTYTVTIDSDIRHGTVTADKTAAAKGETVTLTVVADEGYNVNGVTVNGSELIPEDGVYSFEMPGKNVTVSAGFGLSDGLGARVVGHSLSLNGDVSVNFYMELDERFSQSEGAYLRFLIPGNNGAVETDIPVSDAQQKYEDDRHYYVFKCDVAAKEMSSTITAQLIDSDFEYAGNIYEYSVKEYAEYVLAHQEVHEYAYAAPVVKALLNYGAYSQVYFGKTDVPPANESLTTDEKQLADVTAETIGRSTYTASLPDGVTFAGATLSLKSTTTLSLYFTSRDNEPLTFTSSDKPVERVSGKGYQIARLSGIPAFELSDDFTVTVSANGGAGTVSYSPMNYCYNALNDSDTDANLVNVIKALYVYWQQAFAYFTAFGIEP